MSDRDDEIKEIIRACAEDENLRRIVFEINEMSLEQKSSFEQKVNDYFFTRTSKEDVQAYNFFRIILSDETRISVVLKLKGGQ